MPASDWGSIVDMAATRVSVSNRATSNEDVERSDAASCVLRRANRGENQRVRGYLDDARTV
jgi:hypothetical protein